MNKDQQFKCSKSSNDKYSICVPDFRMMELTKNQVLNLANKLMMAISSQEHAFSIDAMTKTDWDELSHKSKQVKWSFAEALGDTIMEKYEGLYVFLYQLQEFSEFNTIITNAAISSLFETRKNNRTGDFACSVDRMGGTWEIYNQLFVTENQMLLTFRDDNGMIYFNADSIMAQVEGF